MKILLVASTIVLMASSAFSDSGKPNCTEAYEKAQKSLSKADVQDADDICLKASKSICDNWLRANPDGGDYGSADYFSASCELLRAYGANKAVGNGTATDLCQSKAITSVKPNNASDVAVISDICKKETEKACDAKVAKNSDGADTGDGRLMAAMCQLTGDHGGYEELALWFPWNVKPSATDP